MGVLDIITFIIFEDGRSAMDFLRTHRFLRYGLLGGLVAAGAAIVPAVWAVDRAATGFSWFEHVPFLLSLVLAYSALRVDDAVARGRLAIGVMVAFGLAAAAVLDFSLPSLLFLGLALAVGYAEWPTAAPEARAY